MTTVIDIRNRRNGGHVPQPKDSPTCSKCHGKGYRLFAYGYKVTGSGFGDAEEDFEEVACDICDGDGVVDEDAQVLASITYELAPWLDVLALGHWAACFPEGDEDDIRATFRWDAMVAWVSHDLRVAAAEVLERHGFRIERVRCSEAAFHRAVYWSDPGPDAA